MDDVDARLAALVSERDGGRCLFTPKSAQQVVDPVATYILSPQISSILAQSPDVPEKRLLQAYLGPENAESLCAALARPQTTTENAMSLSPQFAESFSAGKLKMMLWGKAQISPLYQALGLGSATRFSVPSAPNEATVTQHQSLTKRLCSIAPGYLRTTPLLAVMENPFQEDFQKSTWKRHPPIDCLYLRRFF